MKKDEETRDEQGVNEQGVNEQDVNEPGMKEPGLTKDPAGTTTEIPPTPTRVARDGDEQREKPGLFSDKERAVRRDDRKAVQADEPAAGDTVWPQKPVGRSDSRPEHGAATGATAGAESVGATTGAVKTGSDTREPAGPDRTVLGDDKAGTHRTGTGRTADGHTPGVTTDTRLLPQEESDKLAHRLQEALGSFVDGPRRSVEEAAGVLEEATEHITRVLAERRRTMRAGWDGKAGKDAKAGADGSDGSDTEDLRLALRSYREVTERLLEI
jgi:hypothetical protein